MLLTALTHPPLIGALAQAGHGSRVLIADGNYPVATARPENAHVIYLNLHPGLVDALTVLEAIKSAVPLEGAAVMQPGNGPDPELFGAFSEALPGLVIDRLERQAFYSAARGDDTAVVVATGETRHFGNLLLTIGVVPMGGAE